MNARSIKRALPFLLPALLAVAPGAAAVAIKGTVVETDGNRVKISYQGDLAPNPGDRIEIGYELDGDPLALEGHWQVVEVSDRFVFAEEASAVPVKPAYGYLATISSLSPVPRPVTGGAASPKGGKGGGSASYDEGYRLFSEKRYDEALSVLEPLAGQGHAASESLLGHMTEYGYGVEKNYPRAVELYSRSAAKGYAIGQRNLATMYDKGRGVPVDRDQAFQWFRKAADQGDAYAQNSLGWYYQNGWGAERNYPEAAKWYRLSAENNNSFAANNLGYLYFMGFGVKKNYSEALRHFEWGLQNGNVNSNMLVGLMYKYGLGTEVDEKRAETHFGKVGDLEKQMRDVAALDFFPATWWLEERGVNQ